MVIMIYLLDLLLVLIEGKEYQRVWGSIERFTYDLIEFE